MAEGFADLLHVQGIFLATPPFVLGVSKAGASIASVTAALIHARRRRDRLGRRG